MTSNRRSICLLQTFLMGVAIRSRLHCAGADSHSVPFACRLARTEKAVARK
jgi:hypothetical protein